MIGIGLNRKERGIIYQSQDRVEGCHNEEINLIIRLLENIKCNQDILVANTVCALGTDVDSKGWSEICQRKQVFEACCRLPKFLILKKHPTKKNCNQA